MSNSINWFEIPVLDFERGKKFYSTLIGKELSTHEMGGSMMGFFPYEDQGVSGAIVCGEGYEPSDKGVMIYLNGGNDLSEMLGRVDSAGGKVLLPKTQITPEIGYMAIFLDSEGNKVALHSQN